MECCWCCVGVVAVNNGGGSGVGRNVGVCHCACGVGGGCGGGCVWVVCFPVLCGGGVCE